MGRKNTLVYDFYLMNLSGLSIFSGCTGTEYCRAHQGQHELHTGFFSAMHSFSQEAFQESLMQSMEMGNVQLNFKIDLIRNLMLILVSPINIKKKNIRKQLDRMMELYLNSYAEKIEENVMNEDLFKQMMLEMKEYGIIHTEHVFPVNKIQMSFDKIAKKVSGFLKK